MTPEDRAYLDKRFADLWSVWNVRPDPANPQLRRDRLTDLWDEIQGARADLDALAGRPGAPVSAGVAALSDDQLTRIATACADELARRLAG